MLLANIAHRGIDYEVHGEPEGGQCRLTLLRGDGQPLADLNRRVPREEVKAAIRRWCADALPGATLVFAYAGADPWPLYTQAGATTAQVTDAILHQRRGEGWGPGAIHNAPVTVERSPTSASASFGDYGARRIEDVPVEDAIVATGRAAQERFFAEQTTGTRRPRHPAADLLGEDEA
jgi:hypothetical protein